jgi:hypothetical protein
MGWFKNVFKTKEEFPAQEVSEPAQEEKTVSQLIVPETKSLIVTATLPKKKPYTFGNLRNNRWVVVNGRLGIVTSFEPELSTVDFVDAGGITKYTERVPTAFIRLARWHEIPAARKHGLTDADGQRLGYHL